MKSERSFPQIMSTNNPKKENKSMYLYTALIFVVALILIILAFFSQTNISRLGKRADEFATAPPEVTNTSFPQSNELAKLANMASELDRENTALKAEKEISDKLFAANSYVKNAQLAEAELIIAEIDETMLSDDQKILLEDLKTKINEGKEQ